MEAAGRNAGEAVARIGKTSRARSQRDDLSVELCALYNQTGGTKRRCNCWPAAIPTMGRRRRGAAWPACPRASCLGAGARATGLSLRGESILRLRLASPHNLGEAKHLLANQSDIHYWLGCALRRAGRSTERARQHWLAAANFKGDFQEMSVRAFSEMTYYSALSWQKLGQTRRRKNCSASCWPTRRNLQKPPAKIDYFATSLPTMLLFDDDLNSGRKPPRCFCKRRRTGLGQNGESEIALRRRPEARSQSRTGCGSGRRGQNER